jgi:hypothetical protein
VVYFNKLIAFIDRIGSWFLEPQTSRIIKSRVIMVLFSGIYVGCFITSDTDQWRSCVQKTSVQMLSLVDLSIKLMEEADAISGESSSD